MSKINKQAPKQTNKTGEFHKQDLDTNLNYSKILSNNLSKSGWVNLKLGMIRYGLSHRLYSWSIEIFYVSLYIEFILEKNNLWIDFT